MKSRLGSGLRRVGAAVAPALLALLLAACHASSRISQPPVNIVDGDTCAVCGMYIKGFPGPRGEAYLQGMKRPLKFGSTRDFFAYVTRADVRRRLGAVYVQDVARIHWAHPGNAASTFMNARIAWYVAEQPLPGAMGPTLASFAAKGAAQRFIRQHGGVLLRYGQITPQLITRLSSHCPRPRRGALGRCVSR